MTEPERYYSTAEVAEQFNVRPRTVNVWIKNGFINGVKPGGKNWRIPHSEIVRVANELYGDKDAAAN